MITVDRLTKTYGDHPAVDNCSFSVQPGRVTGFVGPNGSGKSTTMRMMVGLTRPTQATRPLLDKASTYTAARSPWPSPRR